MTEQELELWNRIKAFEFDRPGVRLTFVKRLAKENGFSESFACEVVEEYRKFIFLCCVSAGQMSPSPAVDLAWHLHLTYTRSYWLDLCENTICRPLHHEPTEGGEVEDVKFQGLYNETRELYTRYFNAEPPAPIWPSNADTPDSSIPLTNPGRIHGDHPPSIKRPYATTGMTGLILVIFSLGCTSYVGTVPIILILGTIGGVVYLLVRNNRRKYGDGSGSIVGCGGSSGCGSSGSDGCDTDSSSDCGDSGGGDSGCSSGCGGGCGGGGD
jgi:hypothetical protein